MQPAISRKQNCSRHFFAAGELGVASFDEEQIRRLDVAVDDTFRMSSVKCVSNLNR
jgi:hypothetical protein